MIGNFCPIYPLVKDTYHIFGTFVRSDTTITIPILFGGDDGHSLFVNDQFVAGGGFGVENIYQLSLLASVTTKIELAGHNAEGGWEFGISALDQVPGVNISANGQFLIAVPEPASLTLLGIGIASIAGYNWRRRRQAMV